MESQRKSIKTRDHTLKLIAFKACHVAVWSDSRLTSEERRYLSHLTETLCKTQAERKTFREIRLQEINEDLVLSEIRPLSKEEKAYVLDTCLEALASDKTINLRELRFLNILRKACGIGHWSYHKRLKKTVRHAKARIWPGRKLALVLACLAPILIALVIIFGPQAIDTTEPGHRIIPESCSGKEIAVSILSPNEPPIAHSPQGQDVFDKVRDSIVSINVSIDYSPVCGGSGCVIGTDDTGVLYIVTNKHVIRNSSIRARGGGADMVRVEVKQHSGAKFDASLDFYSRKYDLAILSVKGMRNYAKPLQMNLKSGLQVGQSIYAVGSPIGLDHSFTAGVISALRETYLQTDATVHSGSSGGPLVDGYGALCAIVTKGHATKDYGFALYSDIILEVLKERKKLRMNALSD
ncbi:MAG: trypsin-like peptidase domain-containing protein [Phycisphaerales bacterium]|nr:MAG: trypsin-like peptidase domain-containing protein [Phycisphaerales bacterium]